MKSRKVFAAIMAMAFVLTACGKKDTPSAPESSAVSGQISAAETTVAAQNQTKDPRPGKVIWSTAQSLTSADAHMWDVTGDIQIHSLCIEGLVEHVGWNHYEPALALSWDISDDSLTYTFHLREGVKFHSGDDFSAEDVVWSAERLKNMEVGSVAGHLSTLETVRALDADTVELTFSEPNPMIMFDISYLRIYSKAQAERDGEAFYEKFVGTGPWKYDEWKPGEFIRFTKNTDWWGQFEQGCPEVIEHRPIPEEATRLAALISGEVDLIPSVPMESQSLLTEAGLRNESLPGISCVDLVMKNDKAPFNNTKMRQAMDLLIPREMIIHDLLGQGTAANIWSQEFYPWYPQELKGVIKPFDETKAKQLIDEAGYNGEPIRIMTRRGRSEKDVEICELLANLWSGVGLNVTVEVVSDAAFTEKRSSGDYEMYMTAWDINSPGFYYRDKYKSHNINRADVDPEFDKMVKDICSETDIEACNEKVKNLEVYVYVDNDELHIFYQQITWGVGNRIQSFEPVGGYFHLRMHHTVLAQSAQN